MKKTLLFIALVFGAANFTQAQDVHRAALVQNNKNTQMTPDQRIEKQIQKMTRALSLTEQQQASIKQILKQGYTSLEPAREAKDNAKAAQIKKNIEQQVEAVLTPVQKAKFEKALADKKQKGNRSADAMN
jgi:Spy/CpxP family protein refolding chaperone